MVDWAAAQEALRTEVDRVTTLLRSVRHPEAPAVGHWSLAEVAMHLSQAWVIVPAMARQDLSPAHDLVRSLPTRDSGSFIGDVWDLAGVTSEGVRTDTERDPRELADRIEERAAAYFRECECRSPDEVRPWLVEGVRAPLPMLTCHLLNETIMHGRDVALADGRPWPIPPASAAMALEGFLVPVVRGLDPSAMVDQEQAAGVRACFDIRVRGGGRYFFVFEDGTLSIEAPSGRSVDCHLSVDPVAFLLVVWGRISQWKAICCGDLVAWGRRPWLGPRLRGLVRNP